MNDRSIGRLRHIDGLRGIAAIVVLYQHLVEYLGTLAPHGALMRAHMDWTLDYLDLGKFGVVVFFAVSGYIVPFSFGAEAPRLRFVVSRFFRLYPAYWLSLLIAVLLLPIISVNTFSAAQVVANATMMQTLLGQQNILGVYWTLPIELIFYGLCFLLHSAGLLYNARAQLILFTAMLGLALLGSVARQSGHDAIPVALPLYLATMFWGTNMRLATLERDALARRHGIPMLLALLVMIPLVWSIAYDDNSHKESVLAVITACMFALLLFLLVLRRRMFTSAPLAYLGAISYSIYLFHPLALEVGAYVSHLGTWPKGLVLAVVAVTLTLFAAHVAYKCVEQPAIRLGRRLMEALSPSRAAPSFNSR